MEQAGGFLSIGMDYPKYYALHKLARNVYEELLRGGGEIIKVTYSQDKAGNDWTTIIPTETDINYSHIGYYGSVHLRSGYFGGVDLVRTMS
ncbi:MULTISPECIES: hypothetical protein [unclassified Exiguobacterium]|uniref:hypothetical protein n=1 Tax=unclassified Exiguobacterium TaxID=2644629 RepID=UPI00103E44EE|nr:MULTISPECIES: hypothetical protein [unclassified Exiguobacterium]TCI26207.1 hypothetical protein EVJ32_07165 [Exiguobacterium sp. SH5S4]TCI60110.1 hypothetical protein EVJ26_11605 [Exiguobacterium sp. SH3S1]